MTDDKCSPVTYVSGDANNNSALDPNEVWIYRCATALTDDTTNIATVTGKDVLGRPAPPAQASEDVDVIDPAIQVVKVANPLVILAGGQVVYQYEVTNPGDDPLANVVVSDDKCSPLIFVGGDGNNNGKLDPGETWQYRCTTNLSVDTTNTVTATGDDTLGNPVSDTDQEVVNVVNPAIAIVKTANPVIILPGQTVVYTYVVTNLGDVPLGGVSVSDDKCAPVQYVSGDANNNGLLETNEMWLYRCTTTVQVDTINTAYVSGQPSDPNGQPLPGIPPVEDNDSAIVDVIGPALNLTKTANPTVIYANDLVTYTFVVRNTGDTPLSPVNVSDDKCSPLTQVSNGNGNGVLEVGESWTYRCTTTQVISDTLNTATATGQPSTPGGQPLPGIPPVQDQDDALVDVIDPAILLDKTADPTQILPGGVVVYTYRVTNVGDAPLSNVGVVDNPVCAPIILLTNDGNGLLDPGETWVFQCSATLTDDTTNTATATGDDPLGNPVQDTDIAFVDVLRPGLQIDKVASPTVGYLGQALLYTYTVRNTGTDPVVNVDVIDDPVCAPLLGPTGDVGNDGILTPGEVWTYQCATVFTGDITNIATVTGEDGLGNPAPPAQASEDVDVINPAIQVVKVANPLVILAGGQVVYQYEVTNPGDDPLANVVVSDNKCSPLIFQGGDGNNNGKLDPGETWQYRCTTNLSVDTTNTVTATGDDTLGNPVSDTDQEVVNVVNPAIAIVKTANPVVILPGQTVVYTYVVTNLGDVPLSGVSVSDDKCAPVQYVSGDANNNGLLDTNETWRYTCTTTVQVDTTNTAYVSGQPSDANGQPLPGISPVEDSDPATVDVIGPALNADEDGEPDGDLRQRIGDVHVRGAEHGRHAAESGERERRQVQSVDVGEQWQRQQRVGGGGELDVSVHEAGDERHAEHSDGDGSAIDARWSASARHSAGAR